jgi:hypothetical protein
MQVTSNISLEKFLDDGYNFASDLIAIEGLHAKLWAPRVARVLNVGISKLLLGSLETKCHLDVAPLERCIIYYKGEVVAFPNSEPW